MRFAVWIFLCGCSSSTNQATLHDQGLVSIDSQKFQSGGTTFGQGTVSASFYRDSVDPYLGCSKKAFGGCTIRFDCKPILTQPPPQGDLGVLPAAAGKITIGGLTGIGVTMPVELTVMDMGMFAGQYTSLQQFMPIFSGGETLTVTAVGGEVPAFATQVIAPSPPTLTSPSGNSSIPVSRSQDLKFTWTGGGSGQLRFQMQVMPQSMTDSPAGLDCSWPVGDGSGAIPAAALQMMPKGSGQGVLSALSASTVAAGAWTVQIAATTSPTHPDGSSYQFASLLLQ
jgi:hypothetical protein